MECNECGQVDDWLGEGGFERVGDGSESARPLVVCVECGERQHAR